MAEVKNGFLKSKMNKDLDSRLVPSGEYRDAVNVQVIKSESEDVGALENVQGNVLVADFESILGGQNLVSVGYFADQNSGRVYAFFTNNFSSTSTAYNTSGVNIIAMWNSNDSQKYILVQGAFLNFHENFPIIGVNILENLLFFTDNRNQPRKINVESALNNNSYYQTEDQISVAKYNPYQSIQVFSVPDNSLAQVDDSLGSPIEITTTQSVVDSDRVEVSSLPPEITPGLAIVSPEHPNGELDQVVITKVIPADPGPPAINDTLQFNRLVTLNSGDTLKFYRIETSMYDVVSEFLPDGTTNNPYREIDYPGDPQFLKDKFVRFSYRFKFDDGEYSILAPFTQACFIPKQEGYFLEGDEQQTFSSTVVEFAENKVNKIDLHIPLPCTGSQLSDEYKVTELDIIYKESDALAVQVVETIPINRIQDVAGNSQYFTFSYVSTKPYKTLPESELIRVYDKVPVKAFSQEVASNRIIYGNFQDKHTPPEGINYQVLASKKIDITTENSSLGVVEYPTSNVKENRNYQIGVVLSDRYGRQSTVILSNNVSSVSSASGFGADTVYLPYRDEDSTGTITTEGWDWPGASLKVQFNEVINQPKNNLTGTPGLYNGDPNSINYNPLGWYSYKIVVKQVEQDYYNVYSAGAMKDIPFNYDSLTPPTVGNEIEPNTSFITILNDNINKVPRDLTEVGPQDKTFRSSVKLFGRVMNNTNTYSTTGNEQFSQQNFGTPGRTVFTTNSIEDLFDLFDVSQFKDVVDQNIFVTNAASPFFSFFKADSNPFIAEFVTSQNAAFQFGVLNELEILVEGTADTLNQTTGSASFELTNNQAGLAIKPGQLVTGSSISSDTYVTSYDETTNVVTFNKNQGSVPASTTLTFKTQRYLKIENLAVLETAPTVSRLDIFWETTTSGLLSDLNTAINEGTTGAVAIDDFDFVAFENALPQGTTQDPITGLPASPTDLIVNGQQNSFCFIDNSNQTIVPQSVLMIVTDNMQPPNTLNNGTNVGKFELIPVSGGSRFQLRLSPNEYFYYEGNTFAGRNTFNFKFIVTTSGGITTELFPDLGISTVLQNVAPIINLPTIDPIKYTDTRILDLLDNENGSKDPNQFRKGLTFSISNISGPTGQTPTSSTYGFTLTPQAPTNGQVTIDQPAKSTTGTPNANEESNFGYYTYDVTATDEGGMSTTVSLTATIGIPNMVDHFNLNKNLQQGDGAVEFFADNLTNLNSTAVIPAAFQVGYTTTNLGYSNPVEGDVCTTGVNDSKYFARAAQAKPITAPSSTFFVYFKLSEASFGTAGPRIGGTYAAIEYRAIGATTWSIATDVFGNQCIFDNLYENFVNGAGQTTLAGMTSEGSGVYPNQLQMQNEDRSQSSSIGSGNQLPNNPGFTLSIAGGRVFVLNDTGEYRIASGNVYNNYNAFTLAGGAQCNDTPTLETNVKYSIGDFANVPTFGAFGIRTTFPQQIQNVYEYIISQWAQGTATCGTGTFQPNQALSFYSACPLTRYLFTPNETLVSGGQPGGVNNEIFDLWDNENLTGRFTSSSNVPQTGTIANPFYARIARADGSNPEGTRDGTYLLVYPGPSGEPEILGPCFDTEQSSSSSSSNSGSGTGTDAGGEGSDNLPDLDNPPDFTDIQ